MDGKADAKVETSAGDKSGTEPEAGRLLVLGGTTEANALLRGLAEAALRRAVTLSLAGRTATPKLWPAPIETRIGGFGGVEGLRRWIGEHRVTQVVDATHPFAARISANVAQACLEAGVPLLAIRRPAWRPCAGDTWIEVPDMAGAVAALGPVPRRVFLTIGRQELSAFAAAPDHAYLVRTIEPVGNALPVPDVTPISARGPFSIDDEIALMRAHAIELVVTKNAGGNATDAKLAAARALNLPVIMVARPWKPDVPSVPDVGSALARLLDPISTTHSPAIQDPTMSTDLNSWLIDGGECVP